MLAKGFVNLFLFSLLLVMNGVGGVLRQGLVSINNLIELEILDHLHQKLKN